MLVDEDWSRMEYSYYLLKGNGLDEHVVMDAINRAKRRFFMRPSYISQPARGRDEARGDQAGDLPADCDAHDLRRQGPGSAARPALRLQVRIRLNPLGAMRRSRQMPAGVRSEVPSAR